MTDSSPGEWWVAECSCGVHTVPIPHRVVAEDWQREHRERVAELEQYPECTTTVREVDPAEWEPPEEGDG